MKRDHSYLFFNPITAFLWGMLILSMSFGDVLIRPNAFMTEGGGDGLKNIYSFMYYLQNDSGTHFSGMNYPYGDHFFYPDLQPLLAVSLQWINHHLFDISDYYLGIYNMVMLLSVGFCAAFLFLILRHFKLPRWYSFLLAGLIAGLSPQIFRFVAHQALGQAAIVPMVWYFLIQLEATQQKWRFSLLLTLTILLFSGFHLYYLPLGTFFILSYLFVLGLSYAFQRRLRQNWQNLLWMLLAVLVPIIIMQSFVKLTDADIATRVQNPWGFFHYVASIESVFIPWHTPFEDLIKYFMKIRAHRWEGYSSVGIIGLVIGILTIIRWGRFVSKRRFKRVAQWTLNAQLNRYIGASGLLLLFAMAIPFIWGLESLLDLLPPLKQFRSLGRFSWAFFYVFTVYTAYYIFLIFKRLRQKQLNAFAIAFLVIMLGLWFANDYATLKHFRTYNNNSFKPNAFQNRQLDYLDSLESSGFEPTDYQGMLALPFYHRGSEKIGMLNSYHAFENSFLCAYHTRLPMLNAYLARAPITKSMQVGQLFSDSLIEKVALPDFDDQRPLLTVVFNYPTLPLNAQESYLVRQSEWIASCGDVDFYSTPLSAFDTNTQPILDRFKKKEGLKPFKINNNNFWISYNASKASTNDSLPFVMYNGFEDETSELFHAESSYLGKGAAQINDETWIDLYNAPIPSDDTLILSVWLEVDYVEMFANLYHEVYNTAGNLVYQNGFNSANYTNYDNGWLRVDAEILPQPSEYHQRLFLKNPKQIVADELLIRPKNVDVYYVPNTETLMFNNFKIEQ